MALGLMCQYLESRNKRDGTTIYENIIDEKSLQLGAFQKGNYSAERVRDTYRGNVKAHIDIIPKLVKDNIKSFRLSSSLFPLFEFNENAIMGDQVLSSQLQLLGRLFRENDIRVTTHPGQFTVLSSDKDSVVQNSIRELQYHAWVFDTMGFDQTPYYAINIHGGKANRSERLIKNILSLPPNVRNRLTLENDEKCYNVKQLLEVSEKTGTPIVLDSHHFTFNTDDLPFDDAYSTTLQSWGRVKALQHLSNTEPGSENASYNERRSHSNLIHYVPPRQLEDARNNVLDIDIEAKYKNIALLKMRADFNIEV